jgi:hypothetical protein
VTTALFGASAGFAAGFAAAPLVPVAVSLLAGLTLTGAVAEPSTHDGACAAGEGVTVVVAGGPYSEAGPAIRCLADQPESALKATEAAGFTYEFVPKQIGFVCQIDGFPDPCNGAPASAYWSLWTGEGGDWVYSTTGSATLRTPVDTIVAWSFGAGDPPPLPVPELEPAVADTTTASPTAKTADPKQWPDAAGERTGPLGTVIAALLVLIAGLATWLAAKRGRDRG